MKARRLPTLVVIVLAIVGLVLADRSSTTPGSSDSVATDALMPVASPPGAVSSAFFCAGGAATTGAVFDSTVLVANPGASPAEVLLTSFPAALAGDVDGAAAVAKLKPIAKNIIIAPRSRAEIHLADLQVSPFAAAVVETNDPDIAVERRVTSSSGGATSSSPCASAPSDTWYIPTGTTTRDARELLAVFNPFPVDAVVNVTFQTSDGFRNPGELQSLPVPGGQLRVLDISALAPRIEQLAASVFSASGRVIVDRLQSFDGSDPIHPAGLAATLGAPGPANVWTFAEGEVGEGLNEVFTVMNPSDATAKAQLEVSLDDPGTNGAVDPIPVAIPARGFAQVVMRDQTRVPANVPHSVTVRSTNDVAVVAERFIGASAPAARHGYAPALGAPLVATRWLFVDGRAVAGVTAEFLTVVNSSTDSIAHLRFTALAQGQLLAIDGLQDVEVPPGGRLSVDVGLHVNRPDLPVVVESDVPVVVERGLYPATPAFLSLACGIPLSEAVSVPASGFNSTTTTPGALPPSGPPSS
ncbi:MAG: hypothetical protein QOI95_538 [Acidimicrobiaceae bacterium]|jgi:hypothetical protein